MSRLAQLQALVWPSSHADAPMAALQASLYRRLLAAVMVMLLLFFLRELQDPHLPALLLPAGMAFTAATWAAFELAPRHKAFGLALLFLGIFGLMAWEAAQWGRAAVPSLNFLPMMGGLFTLIAAPRLGVLQSALSLLVLAALQAWLPPKNPEESHVLLVLWVSTLAMQAVALLFHQVFSRLESRLARQQAGLELALSQAKAMDVALVAHLREPLARLKGLLGGGALAGGALNEPVAGLAVCLGDAKGLAQPDASLAEQPWRVDLARADQVLAGRLLTMAALIFAFLAFYAIWAQGLLLHGFVLGGVAAMLLLLRGSPLSPLRQGQGIAVLMLGFDAYRVATFNGAYPVPSTAIQGVIVLVIAMLSGWRGAVAYYGLLGGFILGAVLFGGLSYPIQHSLLTTLAAMTLVLVVAGGCLGMHHAMMLRLQEQSARLTSALRLRRRLLGTLFHDLANPLTVVAMVAQGEPDEPLDERQLSRLARMVGRIEALLDSAHEFLQGEGVVPAERLVPTELAPLLEEVAELFEHRMQSKQQSLQRSFEPGLKVRTLPVVLRESVLANLLGNAVKFSPKGGQLSLSLRALGDQVLIEVRDPGPGYSAELLEALAQDGLVVSHKGTQGEAGYGLGLGLVKEYLGRLGGRLELENLPQGGACARVILPSA